jgi:hypothetical protein
VSKVAEHYLQDLWKTAETTGERAFSTRRAAAVKQEKQTTRTNGHTKTASLVSLLSSCGRDDRICNSGEETFNSLIINRAFLRFILIITDFSPIIDFIESSARQTFE